MTVHDFLVGIFETLAEVDRNFGGGGNLRVDFLGGFNHPAAALAALGDALIEPKMTGRDVIDQNRHKVVDHFLGRVIDPM